MTTIEELEKKIEKISERDRKKDEKYETRKKEELIEAKHTTRLIFPIIMIGLLCFAVGLFVGLVLL